MGRTTPILSAWTTLWPPVADPLGEALHWLRMDSSLYARSEFIGAVGRRAAGDAGAVMFHVVTSGRCWLEVDGDAPRPLQPGDLALVSHGAGTGW